MVVSGVPQERPYRLDGPRSERRVSAVWAGSSGWCARAGLVRRVPAVGGRGARSRTPGLQPVFRAELASAGGEASNRAKKLTLCSTLRSGLLHCGLRLCVRLAGSWTCDLGPKKTLASTAPVHPGGSPPTPPCANARELSPHLAALFGRGPALRFELLAVTPACLDGRLEQACTVTSRDTVSMCPQGRASVAIWRSSAPGPRPVLPIARRGPAHLDESVTAWVGCRDGHRPARAGARDVAAGSCGRGAYL